MNAELERLATRARLGDAQQEPLRIAFGCACMNRIGHLLEEAVAIDGLATLRAFVEGRADRATLDAAAAQVAAVARSHRGSNSLDGASHAAVSATNALAHALAGRALDAASYAAYAAVYAYGAHAVSDPSAFEGEFAWQVDCLRQLADQAAITTRSYP